MDHAPLTRAQAKLLATIRDRASRGEPAPSYRDLCAEFGWASTGTARDHLRALARKGYITLGGGRARQVRLKGAPATVARVQVLGRVVAGRPEAATEIDEGEIAVPADWLTRGRHFALRVDGDSMREAAILDGDTVVVREQPIARDGEIVVATVEGETTVKRLKIGTDGIRLVAENPRYTPIAVNGDVTIHGVVVAVMRSLTTHGNAAARKYRAPRDHRQPERTQHGRDDQRHAADESRTARRPDEHGRPWKGGRARDGA